MFLLFLLFLLFLPLSSKIGIISDNETVTVEAIPEKA